MGQDNTVPRRINRVEGAVDEVMISGGPGVCEHWGPMVAGVPPTMELWVPFTDGTEISKKGDFTGYLVDGAGDDAYAVFKVPHDYSSITTARVVGIMMVAGGNDMCLAVDTDYGTYEEQWNAHSETQKGDCVEGVGVAQFEIISWDISGVLSNLAALDIVGVKCYRVTGAPCAGDSNVLVLGLFLRYS